MADPVGFAECQSLALLLEKIMPLDLTPRRSLPRNQWKAAYRAARMCARGEVAHGPVNFLAKCWAAGQLRARP
jgi:hypothetical protein